MGNRYADWFRQAEADLQHARHSLEDRDFERNAIRFAEAILEFSRHQID